MHVPFGSENGFEHSTRLCDITSLLNQAEPGVLNLCMGYGLQIRFQEEFNTSD